MAVGDELLQQTSIYNCGVVTAARPTHHYRPIWPAATVCQCCSEEDREETSVERTAKEMR